MKLVTIIASVLFSTIGFAADGYTPFDYDQVPRTEIDAQPPPTPDPGPTPQVERPQPEKEPTQPERVILGPAELEAMAKPPQPEQPAQQPQAPQRTFPETRPTIPVPWPVEPQEPQEPESPQWNGISVYSKGRPQVVVLSGCSWGQRNRKGEFNSSCIPCNRTNTALALMQQMYGGQYTVGDNESCDFWIVNVDSPEGYEIDKAMGDGQYTLTELVGKNDPNINQASSVTPVFVVRYPNKTPTTVNGFPNNLKPGSSAANWWLLGLLGEKADDPSTWRGYRGDPNMAAIAGWAENGPNVNTGGVAATVTAQQMVEWSQEGEHNIWGNVKLVVPKGCNPHLSTRNGRVVVAFDLAPYLEYRKGFLTGHAVISHLEVSTNFKVTVYARGYRSSLPLRIQQETSNEWFSSDYDNRQLRRMGVRLRHLEQDGWRSDESFSRRWGVHRYQVSACQA